MHLTYQSKTPSDSGQAGASEAGEIEITPEMIEAGVDEFFENCSGDVEMVGSISVHEMVSRIIYASLSGQKSPIIDRTG